MSIRNFISFIQNEYFAESSKTNSIAGYDSMGTDDILGNPQYGVEFTSIDYASC
jgi:hypothetical protein